MTDKFNFFKLTVLIIALAIASGCDQKAEQTDLKVGFVSSGISALVVEQMRIQHENSCGTGSCKKMSFIGFSNPPALNNSLIFGEIDVAIATSATAVAFAREAGRDIKYVFPNVLNSAALVVRDDSPYETLESLKGKRVGWYGLPTGGGLGFLMNAGISPSESEQNFDLKQAGAPLLPSLLQKKEVDAIIVFEPIVTRLISDNSHKVVLGPFWEEWKNKRGYPLELSGTAARAEVVELRAAGISQVNELWSSAVRKIIEKPEQYIGDFKEGLGLSSEKQIKDLAAIVPKILVSEWGDIKKGIDDVNKYLVENGMIEPEALIDMYVLAL